MRPPLRLLIVDDHEVVREGLRAIFESVARVEVVGEAAGVAEAAEAARACQPDVALVDLRLAGESGVDACRAIRDEVPDARVIVLTAFDDEHQAAAALSAGAAGFLLKTASAGTLVRAVKGAGASPGAIVIDATIARRLVEHAQHELGTCPLDPCDTILAQLVAAGLTNHEIAARIGAPEATVKARISRLLARLGLDHRTEVAARLAWLGVIVAATGGDLNPPTRLD